MLVVYQVVFSITWLKIVKSKKGLNVLRFAIANNFWFILFSEAKYSHLLLVQRKLQPKAMALTHTKKWSLQSSSASTMH